MIADLVLRGFGSWDEIERSLTLPRLRALHRAAARLDTAAASHVTTSQKPNNAAPDDLLAFLGGPGTIR